MKHCVSGCLLLLLSCCLFAHAQQPGPVPALLEWHSRYNIEQMAFSADGRYFVTIGDDKSAIITDLKKRIPLKRIRGVEASFLRTHPTAPYFYTSSTAGDSLLVHKRSFPSGAIVGTTLVPQLPGCQLATPRLLELSPAGESLLIPYSCKGTKTIVELSAAGQVLQQVGGLPGEQYLNALLKEGETIWAACSQGLWKQQGGVFARKLSPPGTGNYFANMRLQGDTLVLLSNQQLLWYSPRQEKVLSSRSVADFFSQSDAEMGRALRMRFNHPFVLDRQGAVWLANTRSVGRGASVKNRPYGLARVLGDITYPLQSPEVSSLERTAVDPLLAYHAGSELFALLVGKEVRFVDRRQGDLFTIGTHQLPIDDFYFTDTPGKLLLLSGTSASNPAFLLNLANSRLETVGPIFEDLYQYRPGAYREYERQAAGEKLYRPSQQTYRQASYYAHQKGAHLRFSNRDSCRIELPGGQTVLFEGGDQLQLLEAGGKRAKRIRLELPSGQETFLKRYEYHAESRLLVLYFATRMHGDLYVNAVDLAKFSLLRSLNNAVGYSDAIWLMPDARRYVRREGIYSLADDALLSPFPDAVAGGEHYVLSTDGRYLCYSIAGYERPDRLVAWDLKEGRALELGRQYGVSRLQADPHSGLLYSLGQEGILSVWDPARGGKVVDILLDGRPDVEELAAVNPSYLLLMPDGHYMGDNAYYRMLGLPGEELSYSIAEMDALFHRPDKVLAALGYADPDDIALLKQGADRRAKRYSFPQSGADIRILAQEQLPFFSPTATVSLRAALPKGGSPAKGIRVYVNGTAVEPLAPLPAGGVFSTSLELVDAVNHIRLCLVDAKGLETPGDYLFVNSTPARAGTLYVITIGVSAYKESRFDLKYAAKDAQDLSEFFKTVSSYEKVVVETFSNEQVTKGLPERIGTLLKAATARDVVLCYFAGHGVLDAANTYYLATHGMNFNKPALEGIPIETLAGVVAGSASRKKMIFIDACHSGLVDDLLSPADSVHVPQEGQRAVAIRGAAQVSDPPRASTLHFAFNHFNQGQGVDILAASSGNEYAYELGSLKNGVFTYSLLRALKTGEADANRDKQVSLAEVKTYIATMTRQLTSGAQRPNFRQANLYQDISLLKQEDSYLSRLMAAARAGELKTVQELIESGEVEPDQKDKQGFTALHYACREGAYAVVRYLLEQGADLRLTTDFGVSPLYLAAFNGHARIVYYLMHRGASPQQELHDWQLAEIQAKKDAQTLEVLQQFERLQKQEERYQQLAQALAGGDLQAAEQLYGAGPLQLDYRSLLEGIPAIMSAIPQGQLAALEWMLKKGASPNAASLGEGFTPLMIAVVYGQTEMVRLLLKSGADKARTDRWGNTALEYARHYQNEELIGLLQ
ncbi:ankyrin repeat domain-containing protein [Cesiribacter andamanensis]|uniref:Peptidase C14 caspase domain-containing protein n=1 Tax=Cesiribacter andamanensis AMV16 TaxID=1279009 RepID=M7MXU7_9BACT|nr:ankyrin repeat domain-containing protein [Cesiribacter andamanensis]EMR01253.1 putative protein containing caspase domain protein [Cesiribacter andamanensis AMV16]